MLGCPDKVYCLRAEGAGSIGDAMVDECCCGMYAPLRRKKTTHIVKIDMID